MDETKAHALAAYPYGKPGEGEPSEITETRDAFEKRILAFAAEVRRDALNEAELAILRAPMTDELPFLAAIGRSIIAIRALSDAPGE